MPHLRDHDLSEAFICSSKLSPSLQWRLWRYNESVTPMANESTDGRVMTIVPQPATSTATTVVYYKNGTVKFNPTTYANEKLTPKTDSYLLGKVKTSKWLRVSFKYGQSNTLINMDSYFSRKKTTESFKKINISKGQEKMQERNLHRQVEKKSWNGKKIDNDATLERRRRRRWTTKRHRVKKESVPRRHKNFGASPTSEKNIGLSKMTKPRLHRGMQELKS